MRFELLQALNAERSRRQACAVVTDLESGEQRLVREADVAADPLQEPLARAFRSGRSGAGEDGRIFVNVHLPPPRIVMIGAVHISQALAPMAALAGFDLEIVDPRTAFASADRFPGVALQSDWPEVVLAKHPLDAYTALVAVTHDPKIDDHPIMEALRVGCFYVGALGSRKTHARRVERLLAAGIAQHRIDRIEAPIGVDIGAATPGEIAVAILASVISAFRKRKMHAERRGEMKRA
ncbi:XdhC family protein [Aureimonas pseudogalii]|uniref:Xanthine dehydrogenase accessory factor n=1 Tax=Aureimonas pseudogalii TaxID=1744844 RepID=A0A7W6H5Z6_9HYPH|nr:XdhC family protein [Aureimonas pseudogalii]MBB3999200.1 xanthine dehydrogenase accessory factor [Aureimonas pseudogalii]